ncbi:LysR family transcriptional regulator [Gandjariella thermophila]|uniref:LysR family transcriptional regulator n=1 Tax=Gandjariella thermophila TaxID=1931992 RepID=A0A4D4J058_9PSEU|nr:LysR family transcriptional regulator [Gandjariella thermophila]
MAETLARAIAPRLAALRALAREQHVTRAADALGVPQPTVSRWLAELGRELGAPVVVRVGRGVRLTRAGELLADAAEEAMAAVEAGCRRAAEEADPERGRVVFAFLHTMGGVHVPELLRAFRKRHPGVRFTLMQAAHEEMLGRVRAGAADLALTSPLPAEPDLRAAPLYRQPLVLAVPRHHELAGRDGVAVAELAGEPLVGMKPGYGLRQITDELCAAAGFRPALGFEGDEVDTVRGLVAAGLGVALLPAAEPAPPDAVAEVPLRPAATRTVGLVWAGGRPLPPAARLFRDFAISLRPAGGAAHA